MKKEKINLTSIPADAETTLLISGGFYQRLNKLLIDYADGLGKDSLIKSMYLINKDKVPPTDAISFNLETLMILLKSLEESFEEKKVTTTTEIEIDVPEDFDKNRTSDWDL
jgi:hypothetical protein